MSDTDQNEDNLLAPLHEFHQRSQELVKLARAGHSATLEERLAEREKGLPGLGDNQFLIAVAKAGQTEQLREGIAAIQALNDELVALAEQNKADISAQLKESQRAEKGIQAYEKGKAGRERQKSPGFNLITFPVQLVLIFVIPPHHSASWSGSPPIGTWQGCV